MRHAFIIIALYWTFALTLATGCGAARPLSHGSTLHVESSAESSLTPEDVAQTCRTASAWNVRRVHGPTASGPGYSIRCY